MANEKAFHAFLSRLQLHLHEHVGAHVQEDMEAAIAMAQRLEVYCGGDRAKTSGKGPKSFRLQKKGMCRRSRGACLRGPARWSMS